MDNNHTPPLRGISNQITTERVHHSLQPAWQQVMTLSLTEVTSWGILYYSFPVFLAPMMQELHWSQATLTGAYSLSLLVAGLLGIPIGRWLDQRRSPRLVMTLGSLVAVVALGAWAMIGNIGLFYLLWFCLGFAFATTLYEPAFVAITAWFPRRERALTVLTTISGLASVIYLPLAAVLVQHFGWRLTLWIFCGFLALGTLLPHVLWLRPFPAKTIPPHKHDVRPRVSWRLWSFWQLVFAFVLVQLAASAVLIHLTPFLITRGLSPITAATVTGMIGSVSLLGRALVMWRSTVQARVVMTSIVFLLQGIGIFLLLLLHGFVAVIAFLLLFGAGFGLISPARASLVADRFGTATFGQMNGQLALAVTLARALAPISVSFLLARWGNYTLIFGILGIISVLAALILLLPHQEE